MRRLTSLAAASLLLACAACARIDRVLVRREPASRELTQAEPLRVQQEKRSGSLSEEDELRIWRSKNECEPGQWRACDPNTVIERVRPLGGGRVATCMLFSDGQYHYNRSSCYTPLVVAFDGEPVRFTRPEGSFAIADAARTEWVSAASPWLALDADHSGCIEDETELFGATGGARNGFEKLGALDDNGDGRLDSRDLAFSQLVVWSDRDQDRRCRPDELAPLSNLGIDAIDLAFVSHVPTLGGSYEGERTTTHGVRDARIVDVYLAPMP